ncbi:MAG: phosphatidate cytidylyltransferase [Planctomycetota bacterium]|jgi:phosphatidate cytidylyltransferase
MLKNRLLFGTLMTMSFAGALIFDGWLDGSLTDSAEDTAPQATLLCILVAGLMIPAQRELSQLAAAKGARIFTPVTTCAGVLLATSWYWPQLIRISPHVFIFLVSAFALLALLLYQYLCCRITSVLANCGASYFAIIYLGTLAGFVPAIRIEFGLWQTLMFICVVKSADIGAYAFGSLFGKRKFSPRISPGKTWEGMGGAIVAAAIVATVFAASCDIMVWWLATIFGFCFAFIGQMGDLAESMIKRDAGQKDSANPSSVGIPGFGGVLDVIDSVLVAAPFAYLFFVFSAGSTIIQS